MALNKQSGNMYKFVNYTWNVIKGVCPHDCVYCYVKRFPQTELHFDEKELKTNLGNGNTIFVGSGCDMFAENINSEWIKFILDYCKKFDNTYFFQTKNPKRFLEFLDFFPEKTFLGTTIETNRDNNPNAPSPRDRARAMSMLERFRTFVTIEPIMEFDLDELFFFIKGINPEFVNIGADSNYKRDYILLEPSKEKIKQLIDELKQFTNVNLKDNLKRLL